MIIRSSLLSLSTDTIGLPVIGYDNIVTTSNIEATSADVDFPVTNLANSGTHLKWKSGVNTGDVSIDIHPANATTSYVGIAGHNFGTALCSVEILGSSDPNSPFDSPGLTTIVQTTAITDDRPLIFQYVSQQMNTVRIRITSGGDDIRQAAVVYCGALLTLERGVKVDVDTTPMKLGRRNDINTGMSESGNFLGRIVKGQVNDAKAEFAWFTNSWYRANFDPFVVAARNNPFFVAWAPNEYTTDTGYAWLKTDVEPKMNIPTRRFSASLDMRGIA